MGLISLLLIVALATSSSCYILLLNPVFSRILLNKPNSFLAKNRIIAPVVSYVLMTILFPFMFFILMNNRSSAIFQASIEESFGKE